jgi:hypothetical protein
VSFIGRSLDLEAVLAKLLEVGDAVDAVVVHHVRHVGLGVAVVARLYVEHELRDGAMQPCHAALQHREARPRKFHRGLEVEPQRLAHVHMVLHREVELARRAPAAHLDVVVARLAFGHLGARDVRDAAQELVQPVLQGRERRLVRLQLVADAAHFREHGRGVLTLALEHAHLLRERIALALQLLGARLELLALVLERAEPRLVEVEAAAFQARDGRGKFFSQELDIEHCITPRIATVIPRRRGSRFDDKGGSNPRRCGDEGMGLPRSEATHGSILAISGRSRPERAMRRDFHEFSVPLFRPGGSS